MDVFDVVVVGAGLDGLTVARPPARAGLSVLLVGDASTPPQDHGPWGTLSLDGDTDPSPVPRACLGPPIRRTLHVSARGDARWRDPAAETGRCTWRRERLTRHEAARTVRAGVTWAGSSSFAALECLSRTTIVELRDAQGRAWLVHARFVVGADGVFSPVARQLRLDRNHAWQGVYEEVHRDLPPAGPPALLRLDGPESASLFAAHDGRDLLLGVRGLREGPGRTTALRALRRVAARHLLAAGDPRASSLARPELRRSGCVPTGGPLDRTACLRGLLVGEAAGRPLPESAVALGAHLRRDESAGEAIVDHLVRDDHEPLARYGHAWGDGRVLPLAAARRRFRRPGELPTGTAA